MSKKKLPALSTAPMVKGEPQLQRWLNNVKTILENIDLNASSADVVITDKQIADLVAAKLKGDTGSTGLASYFYTAYGNDSAGVDFSLSYSNQSYMGTYTSNSPTQSTNQSDYTWVLFKGADGGGLPQTSVTPTALTGLLAVPTRTFTILVWDPIPLGNDAQHTNIYRNGVDDSTGAQLIGTTKTLIYQDYTSSDGNYYYWISSQSRGSTTTPEGIEGAISGSGTVSAINSKINSSNSSQYFDNGALDYSSYIGGTKPPVDADVTNYSDQRIDNTQLKVGGTNLVQRGLGLPNSAIGTGVTENSLGLSGFGVSLPTTIDLQVVNFSIPALLQNTDYVLSFKGVSSGTVTHLTVDIYPDTLPETLITFGTTITEYKWVINSAHVDMTLSTLVLRFLRPVGYTGDGNTVSFYDIKLEKGNVATDWSPYPGSDNADVTANNTALAIQNQGAFATINQIDNTNVFQVMQAGVIGADFIGVAHLAAIKADLGTVTAGRMRNSNGTFDVNLTDKYIEIAGSAGRDLDDYIRIENGKIQQFEWTGLRHQQASSLNTIESGVASNGQTITLLKYYATQPDIIVTAYDTPIYNAASSAQDQSIQIRAENISEVGAGSGTWSFDAISRLVLSDATFPEIINDTVGPSGSSSLTSGGYTSPANSASVQVSVGLLSYRGTGVAPNYYYRTVAWVMYYRVAGSGSGYSTISAGAKAVGGTLGAVNDTHLFTFPSANAWEFYFVATYSDVNSSTFTSGSGGYLYKTHNRTAADNYTVINEFHKVSSNPPANGSASASSSPLLASFTNTSGYSTYEITYTWKHGYNIDLYKTTTIADDFVSGSVAPKNISAISGATSQFVKTFNSGSAGANQAISKTSGVLSTSSYNRSYISGSMSASWGLHAFSSGSVSAFIELRYTSMNAQIKERKLITNSTTPVNELHINDFGYAISGTTELNTGALGWQAIL